MITKWVWDSIYPYFNTEYFACIFFSIFTLALDIVLLPFELIGFIVHRLSEGEW